MAVQYAASLTVAWNLHAVSTAQQPCDMHLDGSVCERGLCRRRETAFWRPGTLKIHTVLHRRWLPLSSQPPRVPALHLSSSGVSLQSGQLTARTEHASVSLHNYVSKIRKSRHHRLQNSVSITLCRRGSSSRGATRALSGSLTDARAAPSMNQTGRGK